MIVLGGGGGWWNMAPDLGPACSTRSGRSHVHVQQWVRIQRIPTLTRWMPSELKQIKTKPDLKLHLMYESPDLFHAFTFPNYTLFLGSHSYPKHSKSIQGSITSLLLQACVAQSKLSKFSYFTQNYCYGQVNNSCFHSNSVKTTEKFSPELKWTLWLPFLKKELTE